MTSLPRPAGYRLRRAGIRALLVIGLVAAGFGWRAWSRPPRPTLDGLATAEVRRADFRSSLRSGGKTESAENTIVDCKIERLEVRVDGKPLSASGASTVIWVIPEGSTVKKGDLLCSLDSSAYEEIVRQQQMKVDRARSDRLQAQLDFESAQLGVSEFRDGLRSQTIQELEGAYTLAESSVERAKDRLVWSGKMKGKGYASASQIASDTQSVKKAEVDLLKARWTLDNYRDFGAPRQLQGLEAGVETARSTLTYQEQRTARTEERYVYYQKMVENCTIRAPHDGFVIYIVPRNPWSNPKIEAGSTVRQLQNLFYLPDLTKMRVNASIHESVMTKIQPGMRARARIEGMAGREIEGHVLRVKPLPDTENAGFSDVKFFKAEIQLDSAPRGIRPEMTAEVEIDMDLRSNVIAIPTEALAVVDGKDYCYVASEGRLVRRPVTLGGSSRELIEVTGGLAVGESIVTDLAQIDAYHELIDQPAGEESGAHFAVADPPIVGGDAPASREKAAF